MKDLRTSRIVLLLALFGIAMSAGATEGPIPVITSEQVHDLFGDRPARLLVHYPADVCSPGSGLPGPIYFIDLQEKPIRAKMCVEHAAGGLKADPFLSPDGGRVVYGSYEYDEQGNLKVDLGHLPPISQNTLYVSTVEEREPGNPAHRKARVRIAEDSCFDPRWWVHPETKDEYIIYVDKPLSTADDIAGTTYIQKLKTGTCELDGERKVLIDRYGFRGGRSPNGQYICTTLPGFTLAELKPLAVEDALVKIVFSLPRVCNGSISTDPRHPDRFIWIPPVHNWLFCHGKDGAVNPAPGTPPGYGYIQWSEWATDGDYLSASPCKEDDDAKPQIHDAYIYQWSTNKWVKATEKAGTTHLWVGGVSPLQSVPEIKPANSIIFNKPSEVTITCAVPEAKIYYTTDGSEPTQESTLYSQPLSISQPCTIKARAYTKDLKDGWVVTGSVGKARAADTPGATKPGLACNYYEGEWDKLPDFTKLKPASSTIAQTIGIPAKRAQDNFGLRFTGFVEVPADGAYTFYTASDDGSQLFIGDKLVVDNDGMHGTKEEKGTVGLMAGKHKLTVTFFERSVGESLTVNWSGPELKRGEIPANALSHQAE